MADVDNALFEGLFVRALAVSGPLADELAALGYDLKRPQPRYPASVLVACLGAAHRGLAPELEEGEALRQFGTRFVEGFRQTILGRVATTALPILGPARFLQKLPGRFRSIRHDASVTVEATGAHSARLVFNDPVPLGAFFAGVVESALRLSGAASPKVEVTSSATGYSFVATW
jgi:uncharacterized protein (TIGR02265 family)